MLISESVTLYCETDRKKGKSFRLSSLIDLRSAYNLSKTPLEADMIPFFSLRLHGKEQIAGRAVITAAAFLFLCTALFGALPSQNQITDFLEESGLAGYSQPKEVAPSDTDGLEEFYDRPITAQPHSQSAPRSGESDLRVQVA
jgi:hypothetical protein